MSTTSQLTLVILLVKVHCARIVALVPGIRVVHLEPDALHLLKNIREGELRRELRVLVVRNNLRSPCARRVGPAHDRSNR